MILYRVMYKTNNAKRFKFHSEYWNKDYAQEMAEYLGKIAEVKIIQVKCK